jgi:alpha-beta hydrolase superfamily lysophospholipase
MAIFEQVSLGRFRGFVARGSESYPAILALHGAFGHPEQLAALLLPLAERGFTSYALPLTGHAEGTRDAVRGLGVLDYVRDVREMMTYLPSAPILLGHSMGGLICEKVAESEDVRGLILAAAAPAAALMATLKALPTWLGMMPTMLRGLPLVPPRQAIARLAFTASDTATRQAVVETMVPESGRAMRDMVLGAIKVDRSNVSCPVLAFFGDHDYLVPPRQMRREARLLNAKVIEYAGAGHFLVEDSMVDRIADDIALWIRNHVAAERQVAASARITA